MRLFMELKRPFSDEYFQATPESVRLYIIPLEDLVIKLFKETEDLKKRVTELIIYFLSKNNKKL